MANTAELVVKIITDTKAATGDIDATASKMSKFQGGLQKAALPAAAALTLVAGAAISAGKAAAEDAQQQAVLANTMEKTTGASAGQISAMEDYIAKMSMATGVADDELRPAMGNLLRATGDAAESQKAMTAALDISAATGKSVESVSQALAKAYGGSTTSLKKLVPSLDEATLASGNMDAIMGALAETTGGAAAASAETAAGQMKIFSVAMGEAQEEAGTALLPIMSALAEVLVVVAKWIGNNTKLFVIIAGVIGTVAVAVLAVNAAVKVYQAGLIVLQVIQKATWLAALGPIGLVIIAIMAVVAVIVILWNKSETFRSIVLGIWGAIKGAIITAGNAIEGAWNGMIDGIIGAFRNARDLISGIIGAIREGFNNMVGAVRGMVAGLGSILAGPFNVMKSAIDAVIGAVQSLINWLSNIHVPNISLPDVNPFSASAAVPSVATFAAPSGPSARAATGGTSTGGGIHITITGAIDPEATARQVRRILAGHERRVGLAT